MTTESTLLLFTESYPYDIAVEETFIAPQLPYLVEAFRRVIVIPSHRGGRRLEVLEGIRVDENLSILLGREISRLRLAARAISSRLFWRDIVDRPFLLASRPGLKVLVRTAARAELIRGWLKGWSIQQGLEATACVGYTFWCTEATIGLALLKSEFPELVVVSRANGADLFLERHDPPYIPSRDFTLRRLDRLFTVSEYGKQYAAEHYPWFATRLEVSRLGVADPGFVTRASSDGRCVLVSCSAVIPVKRVDLIVRGIAQAAQQKPEVEFHWHHFGDGEVRSDVERDAHANLPSNATALFHGHRSVREIMNFYQTQPVDAFLNASASEGGSPVAIMEAISCGILVIATAVGGNPEIVSEKNGTLVSRDPSRDEIASAIVAVIDNPDAAAVKRLGSRGVWEERFQAALNYEHFAQSLIDLREAGPSRAHR